MHTPTKFLISSGGARVWSAEPREELYVTGALQEGQLYSITVAIIASIGITGTAAQVDVSAQGRQLPPGDVASIAGFEAGGIVRLSLARCRRYRHPLVRAAALSVSLRHWDQRD